MALYAIFRVRGRVDVRKDIEDTLKLLRVHRKNYLSIMPKTESIEGMIQKAKDYITWGEIDEKTLAELLKKRGRISRRKKLTLEYIKEKGFNSFEELAKALIEGKVTLKELGIKPFFRLRPPSKGYGKKGIKKHFNEGGALGYRGEKINDLILRAI
ncbi:NEQ311 [Nanoarchaeum equitans Kin4-M]|uniref:Large ribosomal subunit protein uL30 n=1 Tax=Nanoarchaeum equitans (strain Kin4-M) TaxID=228908 RepID=RL30_NANEQ|nr:RecName: Full=Large ribosomal subunit protein uL30; AltName: Full=50S ribosomal protein L30 [Nanoarchaeum equitans Kin4-M]AAR39160.1 NEQ311 [Nanoarchaeum equitans Kin4-M]